MTIIILNDFIFHESMVGKMKCLAINGEKSRNKEKTLKNKPTYKIQHKEYFPEKNKDCATFLSKVIAEQKRDIKISSLGPDITNI